MSRNIYRLGEKEISYASLAAFLQGKPQKDPVQARMQKILRIALRQELTDRQRDCITLHYIKSKNVKEIAAILSIRPATVYKHLSKGLASLKKAAVYL